MSYKLYLDDKRQVVDSFYHSNNEIYKEKDWVITRDFEDFVEMILNGGVPNIISFDYELNREQNGIDCAKWLKEFCITNSIPYPKILVHSTWPGIKSEFFKLFDLI